LGVSADVRALGRIESVAQLIRCADLLLLPSTAESFGLVALEAMASGVPVVGSRAGGLVEVVTDGESGVLEPPGEVERMAERAIELLENRATWRRYSEQAIEQAGAFSTGRLACGPRVGGRIGHGHRSRRQRGERSLRPPSRSGESA
jgi:glycosyltransferase involved in cell wall biosynthesis